MARIFDLQLPTPTRAVHSADAETSAPSGGVVARSCQKAAHAGKRRETLSAFPLSQHCVCAPVWLESCTSPVALTIAGDRKENGPSQSR